MPALSVRPCTYPGCSTLVARSHRCDRHSYAQAPKTVNPKYLRKPWRELRAHHLREHPLCAHCFEAGIVTPAECVDHRDGNPENDAPRNLQSLCISCHSRKTATEDGGYGNVKSARAHEDALTLTQCAPRAPGFA